jgi:hypothetical protein
MLLTISLALVRTCAISALALAPIDVGEGLAGSVFHFIPAGDLLDCPRWREATSHTSIASAGSSRRGWSTILILKTSSSHPDLLERANPWRVTRHAEKQLRGAVSPMDAQSEMFFDVLH